MAVIKIFLDAIILDYKHKRLKFATKFLSKEKDKEYFDLPMLEEKIPSFRTALRNEWKVMIHSALSASKMEEAEQHHLVKRFNAI